MKFLAKAFVSAKYHCFDKLFAVVMTFSQVNSIIVIVLMTLYLTFQVDSRNDGRDFDQVRHSMRYVGYSQEEIDTVWKLLAAILQLVRLL